MEKITFKTGSYNQKRYSKPSESKNARKGIKTNIPATWTAKPWMASESKNARKGIKTHR